MDKLITEKIEEVWQRARLIDRKTFENADVQKSDDEFRLDNLGAIIGKSQFGKRTVYGWTIDHILPTLKGGTDHFLNLQVLHWKNNKAKGDDFPTFKVGVGTWIGNRFENDEGPAPKSTVSDKVLEDLLAIYPDNNWVKQAFKQHR
jgi:hypothetical protein